MTFQIHTEKDHVCFYKNSANQTIFCITARQLRLQQDQWRNHSKLGVLQKTVKVMGWNKASYNLLSMREIILWNSCETSFSPSLNLNLRSWIYAMVPSNIFMTLLERSIILVFPVHSLSSLKTLILKRMRKRLCVPRPMFNDLKKLTDILT